MLYFIGSSFLFIAEYCRYVLQFLYNHLLLKDIWGCFQVLVIMNGAAVNIHIQFLCEHRFLFHWG